MSKAEDIAKIRQYLQANQNNPEVSQSAQYRDAVVMLRSATGVKDQDQGDFMAEAQATQDRGVVDFGTYMQGTDVGRIAAGAADLPLGAVQLAGNAVQAGANAMGFESVSVGDDLNDFMARREGNIARGRDASERQDARGRHDAQGNLIEYEEDQGMDWSRLGGNVAAGVALTGGVGVAPSLAGKVAQGTAMGAGFGATAPVTDAEGKGDYWKKKAWQTGTGVALGAAFPLAGAGLGKIVPAVANKTSDMVRNIIDPWTEGGVERTLNRLISMTKDGGSTQGILKQLKQGKSVEEIALLGGNTRLAALIKTVKDRASDANTQIRQAQQAWRRFTIRQAGGVKPGESLDEAVTRLETSRTDATQPFWDAAENSDAIIRPNAVIDSINQLIKKSPKEKDLVATLQEVKQALYTGFGKKEKNAMVDDILTTFETRRANIKVTPAEQREVMKEVERIMALPDRVPDESARGLISASKFIKTLMGRNQPNGQPQTEKVVENLWKVKNQLDDVIGADVPAYSQGNKLFHEWSKLVDRASVSQRLERALVDDMEFLAQRAQKGLEITPSMADEAIAQRGNMFANAIEAERTLIASATQFKRGAKTLEELFTPDQMGKILSVSHEVSQDARLLSIANDGEAGLRRLVDTTGPFAEFHILDRAMVILNGIIRKSGILRREKTLNMAADVFQDPLALARVIERAPVSEQRIFAEALNRIPAQRILRTAPAMTATQPEQQQQVTEMVQ